MATAYAPDGKSAPGPGNDEATPAAGSETKQAQPETAASSAGSKPANDPPLKAIMNRFGRTLIMPLIGIVAFLGLWAVLAPQVDTSLGALPGPVEVAEQGVALFEEWQASNDAKAEFYAAQEERIAAGTQAQAFDYAGPPTFLDQVFTSLKTVALGFVLATVVAVPIGLAAGLSTRWSRS